jgi:hypothetical protein
MGLTFLREHTLTDRLSVPTHLLLWVILFIMLIEIRKVTCSPPGAAGGTAGGKKIF